MACCTRYKRQKFLRQAKGFFKSIWLNIKSGFKNVSKKEYDERRNICYACPFFNVREMRCMDCGCYIKVKARLKVEECPQGYWRKRNDS